MVGLATKLAVAAALSLVAVSWAASPRSPTVTPYRQVRQASLSIPNESWLASYAGYVWVKRDDGYVERIDPRTDSSTGRVGTFTGGDDYCQGIGAGGGAVWSCSKSSVTRIDPKRMKIVKTIPVGKVFDQGRLTFTRGRLWIVAGANANQLIAIDPTTNKATAPIRLPVSPCSDLARGGDTVWVLCPNENRVVKVDVARRTVAGVVRLADTEAGYATKADLWVGGNRGLVRVDARSLKQVARFPGIDRGSEGDVAVDGHWVLVRRTSGFLYRIDSESNRVTEHITGESSFGGGSLLVAAGSIWTGADDESKLLRLRR
jgi:streptogramin lyase